jgi:drug/metabolite transporter (DMT)-like permease
MNAVVFFPFIAAALYGLSYVLIERITGLVNMTTFYVLGPLTFLMMAIAHGVLKGERFDWQYLKDNPSTLGLMIVANLAGSVAWLCTTYALKNISASYAAFGEISYPLFTLLFAWILMGQREFSLTTIAGGGLILIGSFILIYGQKTS